MPVSYNKAELSIKRMKERFLIKMDKLERERLDYITKVEKFEESQTIKIRELEDRVKVTELNSVRLR